LKSPLVFLDFFFKIFNFFLNLSGSLPKTDETRLISPVFTKTEKTNRFLTSFSIQPETGSKNLPDDQNSATAESEFWADFLTEPSRIPKEKIA
jgi:hypothetical protein